MPKDLYAMIALISLHIHSIFNYSSVYTSRSPIDLLRCALLIVQPSLLLLRRSWQTKSSTSPLTHQIIIKEIGIQQRLQHPTEIHDVMMTIAWFIIRPEDPVDNVESTIGPHEKDVISR